MSDGFDLVLRGGTVLTPSGPLRCDVGVRGGQIAGFGDFPQARRIEDVGGLHVLPGVIDSQVHFREPGATHKEDLASGTAAAALGGVTAVFEMPNTNPPTTSQAALEAKWQAAAGRLWVDAASYIGAEPGNAEQLPALERLAGVCGVKMFMGSSTGSLLVADDADVARVLASGCRRIAVHCEDEALLSERRPLAEQAAGPHAHPLWRDEQTALRATQRLIRMAEAVGRRVHVLHVTTAAEMTFLADHHRVATVEVTPQHLTLAAPDCYDRLGTLAQMNPPIRDAHHRDALWRAVAGGLVDVIGSDHAPHTIEEKNAPYPDSPSGMPGVQTLVPVMLDHVHGGRLSLARFVDLTSAGPARVFGISAKGRIAPGFDADFTVVDLAARRTINNADMASRCGWTPFDGMRVTGWPMMTVVRGHVVMRDGELLGAPIGRAVEFLETMKDRV